MLTSARHGDIDGVQWLRALAAMFVVYFHTGVYCPQFRWFDFLPREFGATGVDMFFVISGFIMMLVTARSNPGPREFILRRLIRIVPLYWAFTLAIVVVGLLYPAAMLENRVELGHVLLSLAFVPHANPVTDAITPFFKLGWTLNYEMYFYLLFAALLFIPSPGRRLAALTAYVVAVTAFFALFYPQMPILRVYTNPIIAEFAMGAAVGYFYVRGAFAGMPKARALTLCALGLAVLVFAPWADDLRAAVPGAGAVALLCGVLGLEETGQLPRVGWAVALGDASYSLYLAHPIVETLFRLGGKALRLPTDNIWVGAPAVILATVAAALAGLLVHRLIEKPMLRYIGGLRAARARRGADRHPLAGPLTQAAS